MGIRLLVLGCLVVALAAPVHGASTQMWVWVDSKGVTHYSDRPVPGAKLISVATLEPAVEAQPATPRPPPTASKTTARAPQSTVQYELLEIFQPENGETFFGSDAVVDVRLRSEPDLVSGDTSRLYLDGKLVEGQGQNLDYSLSGLERGAHSMIAILVDQQGNEKIRSEPRVFHVRQNTAGTPRAVGPNLRPRPVPNN